MTPELMKELAAPLGKGARVSAVTDACGYALLIYPPGECRSVELLSGSDPEVLLTQAREWIAKYLAAIPALIAEYGPIEARAAA